MNTANEISKRIEDFLNDRCVNGWTVTASKMYDDVRHDVTVEFESMGSAWKFKGARAAGGRGSPGRAAACHTGEADETSAMVAADQRLAEHFLLTL